MKPKIVAVYRIILAVLVLAAIATQFQVHVDYGFPKLNFFSYFTNLSNILAVVVFLTGAIITLRHKPVDKFYDTLRGATVVCMAVVGIVFSILLSGQDLGALLPWVNFVLHYLMPVAVVVDWLLVSPNHHLGRKHIAVWLVFPLVYLAYSLIRGSIVGFYPYTFLNPEIIGGYGIVALYCLGIFILFVGLGWLVAKSGNMFQMPMAKQLKKNIKKRR